MSHLSLFFPSGFGQSERIASLDLKLSVLIAGAYAGQDGRGSRPPVADGGGGRAARRFRGNHAGQTLQLLRCHAWRQQR